MHDPHRPLPDFVVIGAMKAGTTSLYHHLRAHPDICMSKMKETDYFSDKLNHSLGQKWYRAQFEHPDRLCGECSPNYTKYDIFPRVPQLLAHDAPDARLIFLARDPVARFVSHYGHSWQLGHMDLDPAQVLDSRNGTHMLETSRYNAQIAQYLQHFDRTQILFLDFDQLRRDPQAVLDQVCDHIGAARFTIGAIKTQNDAASIARMPRGVQRLWRSRAGRMLDPLVSRGMRDFGRRLLARGRPRQAPVLGPEILEQARIALAEDAARFRTLTGLSFDQWQL